MIRHIYSILWRRKKSNFLLVFQLFVSFLAMSLFIALNIKKFSNYFSPYQYDYKQVWGISLNLEGIPKEQAADYVSFAKLRLQAIPGTETVSNGTLLPFGSWGDPEKVDINGHKVSVRTFAVDENYQRALQLPLLKGKWFSKEDEILLIVPVVITKDFAEEYFKGQDALGKLFLLGEQKVRVSGVSEEYRDDASNQVWYTNPGKGCIFQPLPAGTVAEELLIRSKHANDFLLMEEQVRKALSAIKDEKFIVSTSSPLAMIKKQSNKTDRIQLTIAILIFAFLVLNIFLGISGVFSYAIAKRKPEIGLRVATGARAGSIIKQFLSETILLTSFAVVPGILIAMQFILTGFFGFSVSEGMAGIAGSSLFIYLLMISCCLYPGFKASKIQPAEALHEE